MKSPICYRRLPYLVAVLFPLLLVAGCSGQSQASHEDEVKAFKGDPQKIAEAQAKSMADRNKAEQQDKAAKR